MNQSLQFSNWDRSALRRFDLFVASCGYEPRARHAAEQLIDSVDSVIAYDYASGQVHGYQANRAFFEKQGRLTLVDSESPARGQFSADIRSALPIEAESRNRLHLGIDISSCDRQRIADLLLAAKDLAAEREIDVTFIYSMGDFDTTAVADDAPVMVNEALKGFEGWSSDPALPVVCVVGLGYEERMALAAVETLEPARTAAFIAANSDARFENRVEQINSEILSSSVTPVLRYDLDAPLSALALLDSCVGSALGTSRVVLVPLGPKLFALIAMLVALVEGDDVAVWRVSASSSSSEQAREPAGPIVGITVRFPVASPELN